MSTHLEDQLRRHFERVTDEIELPERTFDPHLSSAGKSSVAFDRRFWIAAATISTDSLIGIPVTGETVDEVRAYDTLLGTARPPSVPDDSTAPFEHGKESAV